VKGREAPIIEISGTKLSIRRKKRMGLLHGTATVTGKRTKTMFGQGGEAKIEENEGRK